MRATHSHYASSKAHLQSSRAPVEPHVDIRHTSAADNDDGVMQHIVNAGPSEMSKTPSSDVLVQVGAVDGTSVTDHQAVPRTSFLPPIHDDYFCGRGRCTDVELDLYNSSERPSSPAAMPIPSLTVALHNLTCDDPSEVKPLPPLIRRPDTPLPPLFLPMPQQQIKPRLCLPPPPPIDVIRSHAAPREEFDEKKAQQHWQREVHGRGGQWMPLPRSAEDDVSYDGGGTGRRSYTSGLSGGSWSDMCSGAVDEEKEGDSKHRKKWRSQ